MIVANPLSKILPNLLHSLNVIDVKVTVTSPLTVIAKYRSLSLTELPNKLPSLMMRKLQIT